MPEALDETLAEFPDNRLLIVTGDPAWIVPLEVRLHRLRQHTNKLTRENWAFLSVREPIPLLRQS